jgi:electron transfer flavoprotein alpha/beta subunit
MVNAKLHLLVYVCEAVSHEYSFEIDSRNKKVLPRFPELGKKIDLASRCALEEALLIKERIHHVEISAITAGPPEAEWVLRTCLGLGADQAIHLVTDPLEYGDDYTIATLLSEYVNREKADLILCGDCTENYGYSQIGPILAELLGYPFLSGIIGLEMGEEGRITVQRKVARGHRLRLQAPLPAVVSVNRMINLPRYISVHTQIKPLKKPIAKMDLPYENARAMELISVGPFKPRAKKSVVPSGENRLDFLMSGGTSSKEDMKLLEGNLGEASEKIIQLLKEENIL